MHSLYHWQSVCSHEQAGCRLSQGVIVTFILVANAYTVILVCCFPYTFDTLVLVHILVLIHGKFAKMI
jgi:hypothetical protein